MKIVRLYYRRDEARELDRFYIRKVANSKTIGVAICRDSEQYNYLKSHIYDSWKTCSNNRSSLLESYADNKLVIIGTATTSGLPETTALDNIYKYLKDDPGRGRASDVIRAYSRWWMNIKAMSNDIANNTIQETWDSYNTIFHDVAPNNSYIGGDNLDGELISYTMSNMRRCCEDCDYTEFDDDPYDMVYIDNGDYSVCSDCYSEYYGNCSSCGENHHHDYLYYEESSDHYYCDGCGTPNNGGRIHSYDYTPYLNFYDYKGERLVRVDKPSDVNLPFYGAELEVECLGGSKGDLAESISNYGGGYEKFTYCKNDGSLNDGFEVCFMPMTFHAIKHFKFYDAVLKYRGRDSLQSYNTSTCGMHIHINREAFTDHHLFKFISFVHEFKSLVYLVSQRKKTSELNSYARFNNGWKDRAKKSMVDTIKRKKETIAQLGDDADRKKKVKGHSTATYGEKYVPINLQHINTIEVRIFKGNLLESSFRKNFEFVDSLYYFTRDNPIYKLKAKEFVNYCTNDKKRYPNLNMFLANNTDKLQDILRFPLAVPEGLNY